MQDEWSSLRDSVQHNCHISDAAHAGDYTLCVYLMKMREFYRWEKGYAYADSLPHQEVGDWLREREQLWEDLEASDFVSLPLEDQALDPLEAEQVNTRLLPQGLVYSAGYGQRAKPHFFLGRLDRHEDTGEYRLIVAGEEFARDLTSPPAMSQNGTIFIRRQALRQMIWEKMEEWRWNRLDNPMGRAIRAYDFEHDPDGSLDTMAEAQIDTFILHEIGEVQCGRELGPEWEEMLASFPRSRAEIQARAVRDNLADALSTLPRLLDKADAASLHFYFATLTNMRKSLTPSLVDAYQTWHREGNDSVLKAIIQRSQSHWRQVAEAVLEDFRRHGRGSMERIPDLIETNAL